MGSLQQGPDTGRLLVKTYREGVAAKVGHDLVIEVTRWEATVDLDASTVELTADARSLEVREGVRGVKPLTDKDRREIAKTIDDKVLRGQPIAFRSSTVRSSDRDGPLVVEGELTMAGDDAPRHRATGCRCGWPRQRDHPAGPDRLGDHAVSRADGRAEGPRRGGDRDRGAPAGALSRSTETSDRGDEHAATRTG